MPLVLDLVLCDISVLQCCVPSVCAVYCILARNDLPLVLNLVLCDISVLQCCVPSACAVCCILARNDMFKRRTTAGALLAVL